MSDSIQPGMHASPDQERLLVYIEASLELAELLDAKDVTNHLQNARNALRATLGMPPEPLDHAGDV